MSSTGQREPSKVEDLGHSKIDVDRMRRLGIPEAVFAAGKTVDQCVEIVSRLLEQTNHPVVVTRSTAEQRSALRRLAPQSMQSNTLSWQHSSAMAVNPVVIVSGGTSDESVVDEAQVTLHALGAPTKVVQDVGVAGLHRLLDSLDGIAEASVVIVVAGMEGSLSTVLTGLVPNPIIAVPTSVGYGSSLEGVTAMLSAMASCAPGMSVVGIDNGYGAACAAMRILNLSSECTPPTLSKQKPGTE